MGAEESKTVGTVETDEKETEDDTKHGNSAPLDTQEKELAHELQRVVSKHQLPKTTEEEDGFEFLDELNLDFEKDDLSGDEQDSTSGDLDSRVSHDTYVQARRNTLATYNKIAKLDAGDGTKKREKKSKKFDTLVKQRSNVHSLKKGKTLKDLRSKSGRDLKQMNKIKSTFFETLNQASRVGQKARKRASAKRDGGSLLTRATTYVRPWIDQVERKEAEVESAVKFQYTKMEKELHREIEKAREAREKDAKAKEELTKAVGEVTQIKKKLLERQKHHFASAKEEAVRLEKLIKAKIKQLEAKKKQKAGENYRVTHAALIEEAHEKKKRNRFSLFRHAKKQVRKMTVSPEQAAVEEEAFKKELDTINAELIDLRDALMLMQLEKQFPRTMRWKLRIDAGGGLYIGMRDVEVESLVAKYHVESGGETGLIRMRVFDLVATIGILEFVFAGKSYLARFLGGVFTPTVNRLDLVCHGEWELWLRYNPRTSAWDEDPKRSKFNLDFKKKVTGITTIRLPAVFVKLLTNTIFPMLISAGLKEAFPAQLATFEYDGKEASSLPYLAQEDTHIDIHGRKDDTLH